MSILIDIQNEQEKKVLIAFLESLNFKFRTLNEMDEDQIQSEFLKDYNDELDKAGKTIDSQDFVSQSEVENLLSERRKSL